MSKKILIGIILLLVSSLIHAKNVEEMKLALKTETNDSIRCIYYEKICHHLKSEQSDSSLIYGKMGLDIARKNNFKAAELKFLQFLGWVQLENGQFNASLESYKDQVNKAKLYKDTFALAHGFNGLGLIYSEFAQYKIALEKFQEVHKLALVLNDNQLLKFAINNIGLVNIHQERYPIAIEYFEKLLQYGIEKKDSISLFSTYINLGDIHTTTKEYDKAEEELLTALDIILTTENFHYIAVAYVHLGRLYESQKKYQKALKYSQITLDYCNKNNFNGLKKDCYLLNTTVNAGLNRYEDVKIWAKKGIKLGETLGFIEPEFYNFLAIAYEKTGHFEEAYFTQSKFHKITDSLYTLEKDKEFDALEVSFQTKEKVIENALLLKEKNAQASALKQKSIIIGMISTVLFLLFVVALQQIFARKKVRKLNDHLESEVHKRTLELKQSNDQLTKSNEEIKRFTYIASHDLKEPVRNIGRFISLIKRRGDNLDKETQNEYLDFIHKSNNQLTNLVDSILKYSDMDMDLDKQPKREITNLKTIVEDVKILLWGTIRENNVQIQYNDLPTIDYYPYVVKIAIKNLIENGIKYNKSSTPIINIKSEVVDDKIKISITDNGIGINPAFHQKIFEMFSRLNNRKEYIGSGMGLAYCKKLLEKFQGSVEVCPHTKENTGATFILTLSNAVLNKEEVVVS